MSESGGNKPDLSEVVSKIMEHPEIVDKISEMLSEESEEKTEVQASTVPAFSPAEAGDERNRRQKLLGALRPYLSSERVKLLDSMSAVLDLMETMGRGS